ncbi:MAG: hypothetical protein AAF985_27090, partial [Bacteroidota bacterium]
LSSAPSRPMRVNTRSSKPKSAFAQFEVDFNKEKKESTIRWDLQHQDILEEIIVYRGPSQESISMYQIVEPNTIELKQSIADDEAWYFLFKPIFNDGSLAQFSEIIEVKNPDDSKD